MFVHESTFDGFCGAKDASQRARIESNSLKLVRECRIVITLVRYLISIREDVNSVHDVSACQVERIPCGIYISPVYRDSPETTKLLLWR
jgi:hypothetical protein